MTTTLLRRAVLAALLTLSIAPLAHPIATRDLAPPPLSLQADKPKDPAYVAGLPGLPQGRMITDDYGNKKAKYIANKT